jgi:hypothetical protein
LPTKSSALVGQDRSVPVRLDRQRCRHPCGATAVQLAVEKLIARPGSHALVGCNRCLLFDKWLTRNVSVLMVRPPFGLLF